MLDPNRSRFRRFAFGIAKVPEPFRSVTFLAFVGLLMRPCIPQIRCTHVRRSSDVVALSHLTSKAGSSV